VSYHLCAQVKSPSCALQWACELWLVKFNYSFFLSPSHFYHSKMFTIRCRLFNAIPTYHTNILHQFSWTFFSLLRWQSNAGSLFPVRDFLTIRFLFQWSQKSQKLGPQSTLVVVATLYRTHCWLRAIWWHFCVTQFTARNMHSPFISLSC
jgi:hypothetical protein